MRNVKPIARVIARTLLAVAVAGLAACATPPRGMVRMPVPQDMATSATVADPALLKDPIRYWADMDPDSKDHSVENTIRKQLPAILKNGRLNFLSLSGGGYNGAFGAGYLVGWSERGERPDFNIVTGISVGALIAPFAFLGAAYDQQLIAAFEQIAASDVDRHPLGLLFGATSLTDNSPLQQAIADVITDETLAAIGREHQKGRRLFIGTTNIDVERPVIWDIGAIAISAIPDKVALVRKILLASAAIPGIYPPVLFDVSANGQQYNELHVDGGITQQVVLVPNTRYTRDGQSLNAEIFVIFNGQLAPYYEPVEAKALDLLFRTAPTFLKYQGRADVERLRTVAQNNGAKFKLAAIPPTFEVKNEFPPDQDYLSKLLQLGYEMGKAGEWAE